VTVTQDTADANLIRQIARRALDSISGLRAQGIMSIDLQDDLADCHAACPLRLAALLATDDFSFATEILAIRRHLDRVTGELGGGYVPRFRGVKLCFQPLAGDRSFAARKRRQRARDRAQASVVGALSQGG